MGGKMPSAKMNVKYFAMQSLSSNAARGKNFNARANLPLKPV
jgi:hypothetical protein